MTRIERATGVDEQGNLYPLVVHVLESRPVSGPTREVKDYSLESGEVLRPIKGKPESFLVPSLQKVVRLQA